MHGVNDWFGDDDVQVARYVRLNEEEKDFFPWYGEQGEADGGSVRI